jgi:hypothetical protein
MGYRPFEADLSGRVGLVTGANSGMGKETARELARMGAQVILGCRSTTRGEAARREMVQVVSMAPVGRRERAGAACPECRGRHRPAHHQGPPGDCVLRLHRPRPVADLAGRHRRDRPTALRDFRMNVRGDGYAADRFLTVEPDRRIVFTWGWEGDGSPVPPGSSTVEITLEPDGDEGTLLTLVHRGLPLPALDLHRDGWNHYLDRLTIRATGGDPGPDAPAE